MSGDTSIDDELTYDSSGYRKHKRPEGWGSLCPEDLDEDPEVLLNSGVLVGKQRYNVSGKYAFAAQNHHGSNWHGYPIAWKNLPTEAKNELISSGRLDRKTYDKALRKNWGS
ncbi:MAG: hypothetical protein IV090_06885 [Candidatus Sericytochromatia bacterium]|nr:hypothetical protein [Candidatus Sericytochromatia bacterium]